MPTIEFTKYHGCGNDFVVVDARRSRPRADRPDWPDLARAWCPRHTGIGADQLLLLVQPSRGADVGLRIYNADGSGAAMCGNGLRCVARHVSDAGGPPRKTVTVSIGSRIYPVGVRARGGVFQSATVRLGEPDFSCQTIPVKGTGSAVGLRAPREIGTLVRAIGYLPTMTCVGVGNPHAVFFGPAGREPDDEMERIARAGSFIERHSMFPRRINVQFVRALSRQRLRVRTWERGAGVTLACGSGACAAAAAAIAGGMADRIVDVELLGGVVRVEWPTDGELTLTGPADRVFTGAVEVGARSGTKRGVRTP